MASIILNPSSVIEYGGEVAWIEAAYAGALKTSDGKSIPAINSLRTTTGTSISKSQFQDLTLGPPSVARTFVRDLTNNFLLNSAAEGTHYSVSSLNYDIAGSSQKSQPVSEGFVTVDNSQGTIPLKNTLTLKADYLQSVATATTHGWTNTTTVELAAEFGLPANIGKITTKVANATAVNFSSTKTNTSSETLTYQNAAEVTVPPHETTSVGILFDKLTTKVPFSGTITASGVQLTSGRQPLSNGQPSSTQLAKYDVPLSQAIALAKQFLAPNTDYITQYENGTASFLGTGVLNSENAANFAVVQRPVTATQSVPEPTSVSGITILAVLICCWKLMGSRLWSSRAE